MYALGITILVLQCYIYEVERKQIFRNCKKYVKDYWNLIDVCIIFGMTTTVAATMLGCDFNEELRLYIAPTTMLMMFTKFYDWLRLFEIVSLWTQLIETSVIDAFPLIVTCMVCMISLGIPIAILELDHNLYHESHADLHELVDTLA